MSDLLKEFETQKEKINDAIKLFSQVGYGDHKKLTLGASNTFVNLNQEDRRVLFGNTDRKVIPGEVLVVRLDGALLIIPECKKK
jgi:hypothetical protein